MLGRRGRAGADDLAVEPDRVHDVRRLARRAPRERVASSISAARRAERLPLDGVRGRVLLERLDPARGELRRRRRRLAREHERDGVRVLVAARARARAAGRRGPAARRAADLPLRLGRARARAGSARTSSSTSSISSARSAAAGRCSSSCPARCRACSAASRSARPSARAGRRSSGTRRSRAARQEATLWRAAPWPSG